MDKWVGTYVKAAVKLIALGIRTSNTGNQFEAVDVDELGARLKANGALIEMMNHVASTPEFTVRPTWESSPTAIQTLIDMRAEKNA